MNCLIVDENAASRSALRELALKVGYLNVVAEFSSAKDVDCICQQKHVDLLFLDAEMSDMNGLELTRQFDGHRPIIVLTSAKRDYAAEAFELNVADYVIKPVSAARFLQTMEKVNRISKQKRVNVDVAGNDHLFIRDGGMLRRVMMDDIDFLEAKGDYVKVFARQRFHVVHMTFSNMANRLPNDRFLRVHRSYIIAINKVERIEEGDIMINNRPIPVADSCRSELNRRLNII